jgi:hypothetical protein
MSPRRHRTALLVALCLGIGSPATACGGSSGDSDTPSTVKMMTQEQMDEIQKKVEQAVASNGVPGTTTTTAG